jgi:hypothetical protein
MLLAIISDTHDNLPMVNKLVETLRKKDVKTVIHAGDVIAPFTLKAFKGLKLSFVYGNNDGERKILMEVAEKLGFQLLGDFGKLEIDGLNFAVIHGQNEEIVEALAKSGMYDVVVRGHSHVSEEKKVGKAIVLNPGEVCGYLTGKHTFMLFDTEGKKAKLFSL